MLFRAPLLAGKRDTLPRSIDSVAHILRIYAPRYASTLGRIFGLAQQLRLNPAVRDRACGSVRRIVRVIPVRSCHTTTKLPQLPHDGRRLLDQLPYGGSDRSVVLRSLPLSTLHTLLLVACTMVFFITLASAQANERGVSTMRTVLCHPPVVTATGQRSASRYFHTAVLCSGPKHTLPTDAISHLALSSDQNFQSLTAIVNFRRELPDPPTLSASQLHSVLCPRRAAAVKSTVACPSEPSSVRSANLPRLS